jgi:hypothetical protein
MVVTVPATLAFFTEDIQMGLVTVPATLAFFTEDIQMGLQVCIHLHLTTEGIDLVEDLAEFAKEDNWRQVIDNCRKPPKILDANGNLVEQEAFHLGAKSLCRLQVAAKCINYYLATGRDLSPPIMQ